EHDGRAVEVRRFKGSDAGLCGKASAGVHRTLKQHRRQTPVTKWQSGAYHFVMPFHQKRTKRTLSATSAWSLPGRLPEQDDEAPTDVIRALEALRGIDSHRLENNCFQLWKELRPEFPQRCRLAFDMLEEQRHRVIGNIGWSASKHLIHDDPEA